MAVTDVECTMIFTEKITGRDEGWSETHTNMTKAVLTDAMADLTALARLRVKLLGAGVELTGLKVSDAKVWRDSKVGPGLVPITGPQGPYYNDDFEIAANPGNYELADFGHSSYFLRMESAAPYLYRRSHWLCGNPDSAQNIQNASPQAFAAWNRAYVAYRNLLVPAGGGGNWGFRVKSRDPATTFETPIDNIQLTSGTLVFANLPDGFTSGKTVIIRNVRGITPRLSGTYIIDQVDPAGGVIGVTLLNVSTLSGPPVFTGEYTGTGYMRLLVGQGVRYTKVIPRRFGGKKLAGNLYRSHGTQKTRTPVVH